MRNAKRIVTVLCGAALVAALAVSPAFGYGGGSGGGEGGSSGKTATRESKAADRATKEVVGLAAVVAKASDGGGRSVELTKPGTATTVAVGARPGKPEGMTQADRARVQQAEIKSLPVPKELQ